MTKFNSLNPNDVKELCINSDDIATNAKNGVTINGWSSTIPEHHPRSNFKAVAYQKGNDIVICYVGTGKNIKDWGANFKMPFTPSKQMYEAEEYYNKIKATFPGCNIYLAGHSEGGSEAQFVCARNGGIPTYTFNAFMAGGLFDRETRQRMNEFIVNFRHPDDGVSKMGLDIGLQYIVPSPAKSFVKNFGDFNFSHHLKNIGDCTQAMRLEDYKRKNKNFVSKLDETVITSNDIKDMDSETYSNLHNYLVRNPEIRVMESRKADNLALTGDLIYVSAYVRDDGTQVDSYYRHKPSA